MYIDKKLRHKLYDNNMEIIKTKTLTLLQEEQINQLWNEEYPTKLNNRFKFLLDGVSNFNHYIIEDEHKNIIAWALDFEKDNEIRFSIIVDGKHQHKGFGILLLGKLKENNSEFYGWVIDHNNDLKNDGTNYQSPLTFYFKQGFEVLKEMRIESEMINAVKMKWKIKACNFLISSDEIISQQFLKRNIADFNAAINFMKQMPYGRNANKNDLTTVFIDNCGTCSSKHALLKLLTIENNFTGIKLIVGLFKMNGTNTPEVAETLQQKQLEFIPEAHCYLKYGNEIIDVTKANSQASDFVNDLIEEIEIQPNQITDYKVEYHKKYLKNWLNENQQIKFSVEELWEIREQCIRDLFSN